MFLNTISNNFCCCLLNFPQSACHCLNCVLGNNRPGIPAVSTLIKQTRRFSSGYKCATSSCSWLLFVHNLLLFLIPLLSSKLLLIYWNTSYFLPSVLGFHILDLIGSNSGCSLKFPVPLSFHLSSGISATLAPFVPSPIEKDWYGFQVKPHTGLFGQQVHFDPILRGLWESFFQAENAPLWRFNLDHVF